MTIPGSSCPLKRIHKRLLILLLSVSLIITQIKCDFQSEDAADRLDAIFKEIKTLRYSRDIDDSLKIWQKYEFGTGAGNREELIVYNISIEDDKTLTKSESKSWQYSGGSSAGTLAGKIGDSNLWIYRHGNKDGRVHDRAVLTVPGTIVSFKVVNLINEETYDEEIVAVLCVEYNSEIKLLWYKHKGGHFEIVWSTVLQRRVKRLDFFVHRGRNRLLILNEPMNYQGDSYSSIEIYGFDFGRDLIDLWLCQRIWMPRVSGFEICSIREDTFLNLWSSEVVSLYEFKESETKEGLFVLSQNISSIGLNNSLCFENGYTEYLTVSGSQPALFTYLENEFVYDDEMEKLFNDFGETLWVQCLPVKTYREECLLIIQLKNLTLVGLSWQGQNFAVIDLPPIDIDDFQLSKVIPIPKYGFLYDDKLVKIEAGLRDLTRPAHNEMAEILRLRNSLEETFTKQEMILNETEKKIKNSYLLNPVITGFWNLPDVKTKNVTIPKGVTHKLLVVGTKLFTSVDTNFDLIILDEKLGKLDKKIEQIGLISKLAVRVDATEVDLKHGFSFTGGLTVRGSLNANNLTLDSLNGLKVDEISNDFVKYDKEKLIKGRKSFPSIEADDIRINKINGIPIGNLVFDTENKNYENINFTHLNRLVVNGSLNFVSLNGLRWNDLMNRVVWKNQRTFIPGLTTVDGEIVTDIFLASNLNGLKYPEEYVLQNDPEFAEISGQKSFDYLKVANLRAVKRINGIPFDDFVTLNKEQSLPNEITFKNLAVDELLQIDGNISGIEMNSEEDRITLKDRKVITADTMFMNLYVNGNIMIENSVKKKTLADFEDILSKNDDIGVITGRKNFLGNVNIDSKLIVTSKKYNGHAIDEYATFAGEQEFPNLRKISAPVTFDDIKYKQLNDLENLLSEFVDPGGASGCSNKKLVFTVSPIFEDISFRSLNGAVSAYDFSKNFHRAFQSVNFENLEVKNLHADSIAVKIINGVDFSDFDERRISASRAQILTGNYTIQNLKARVLSAERLNGIPLDEFDKFRADFEDLFDRIWNGKMTIDLFEVKGRARVGKINGELISNIYSRYGPRNVIVPDGFHAGGLEVHGFVNGINFTEYLLDSVFKSENSVILSGEKTLDLLKCKILQVSVLNGNPIEDILTPSYAQTLTGPVLVNGNVEVTEYFNTDGRLNDIPYKELIRRFTYAANGTFNLYGDFRFPASSKTAIKNLWIDGTIMGIRFNDFMDSLIFLRDPNRTVEISATKVFANSVNFAKNLTILDRFNHVDLIPFNEQAVRIDRDIDIGTKLVFEDNLTFGGDLIVLDNFYAKTISNVDIEELKSSAVYLDRPSSLPGTLTFTNAIFEANMNVHYLNDVDLSTVILLREEQIIFDPLSFANVTVDRLEITGTLNGYQISEIFQNTLMIFGNQTVTGKIIFHGNVTMASNFDPRYLNYIDTSQLISLTGDDKFNGEFEFSSPLILRNNLRVLDGLINDIDPATWETEAVYDIFPKKQLILGNWTVEGNVIFEKNVLGYGLLNGVDVRRLSDELEKRNLNMDLVVNGAKMDLKSTCQDLAPLQKYAKNQLYKFKYFDYYQILNFDSNVRSAHHFESTDGEFLLINLERCFLNIFFHNESGFALTSSLSDFDAVDKWTTLIYQNEIYLVTVGNGACRKGFGNLWKFDGQELIHIFDLGSVTDVKKIGDYVFLVISEERLMKKCSIEDINLGLYGNSTLHFSTNGHIHFVPNTERILIVEDDYVHEFHSQYLNRTSLWNHFGNGMISGLQVGIYRREMFLYYDEEVSENSAFIFDGLSERKIRQSISTHKPSSFLIINFDGFVETFLTFVKNGRSLEIFEYKGIEGFVYRESIKMQIRNTFGFKLRKRLGLSKTNFFAALYRNTLTIFEAKMYGEKLDVEYLICED